MFLRGGSAWRPTEWSVTARPPLWFTTRCPLPRPKKTAPLARSRLPISSLGRSDRAGRKTTPRHDAHARNSTSHPRKTPNPAARHTGYYFVKNSRGFKASRAQREGGNKGLVSEPQPKYSQSTRPTVTAGRGQGEQAGHLTCSERGSSSLPLLVPPAPDVDDLRLRAEEVQAGDLFSAPPRPPEKHSQTVRVTNTVEERLTFRKLPSDKQWAYHHTAQYHETHLLF